MAGGLVIAMVVAILLIEIGKYNKNFINFSGGVGSL